MIEITSVNNDIVKETAKLQQKKYRQISGRFLLEGQKLIEEALKSGITVEKVFVIKENYANLKSCNAEIILTNRAVMKKISTTDTAPEIAAVALQPENNIERLKASNKVILLENIADAGNLGTIIRTAAAFKIGSVVLYGDTVDIYNPKCVRSTVGNLWKTNIVHLSNINDLKNYFKDYEILATLPKTKNSVMLKDWKPAKKSLVMFGSEANGLSDELKNLAGKNLTIEMNSDVESLNLGISAGIVMYKMSF